MKAAIHICVSGFSQNCGYYHGILKLRESLLTAGHSEGVASRVWYLPWTSNFRRVANELGIICNQHGIRPQVMIAGYSYGGWGAIQLAKELSRSGIFVRSMVLSDPVARPWFWPRPLPAVSSMLGRRFSFALRVPSNVLQLFSFYQIDNRPQGHKLIVRPPTLQHKPVRLDLPHTEMDDAEAFHACVLDQSETIRRACQ